jgi:hypothetical protein
VKGSRHAVGHRGTPGSIDPVQLRLVDEAMQLRGQCACGLEVVATGLLDHDRIFGRGAAPVGEALDHQREQARWNLEVLAVDEERLHRAEQPFGTA